MNLENPRRIAVVLAGLIAAAPAFAQAQGAAASGKMPTVNGVAIPKSRVDAIVKAQEARGVPDSPDLRNAVTDQLITTEVIAQEATRKGLAKTPEVQSQLDLARQQILVNAYRNDFVKNNPISEAALKAEYEKIKSQVGDKEYKLRHILVETEDQAKAIIANLKKGQKFEDLAKQSKDPGSKDHGGDLGWATPNNYVKPFSEAMVKLEKGKYTEAPVKTDFGYHVIMLEDTRELKMPALEDVKGQIAQGLQQKLIEQHIAELRSKANVE